VTTQRGFHIVFEIGVLQRLMRELNGTKILGTRFVNFEH